MKRRRRPIKAITMIEIGVAGILLLLLVLLVYWYVDGISAYKPKSEVHQFMGGMEFEYGEDTIFRENSGSIVATDGDDKRFIVDTPLLYKGETKLTIPVDMLLMMPLQGTKLYRITHFTTITETDGKVVYTLDKKKAEGHGGFMYDGEDLYIFLDPTTINIGNTIEIELPPLSYAKVKYGQYVDYHNSETDENQYIAISEFSDVRARGKGFDLGLTNDVIYLDEQEAMLYSAVPNVDVIEMK